MSRSIHHDIDCNTFFVTKHPVVTIATEAVFDRKGFAAVTYVIMLATTTATTPTLEVALQSGTATSLHTLATTAEMIGLQSAILSATVAGGNTHKVSYIGSDRYTSIRFDSLAANATGAVAILAIGAKPIKGPTSQTTATVA